MIVEIKYVLQTKVNGIWLDTPSFWYSGYYEESLFQEMLQSNLYYARKNQPDFHFRIIKRTSKIVEEDILYED